MAPAEASPTAMELAAAVTYADGAIVSKTILKTGQGNITLFAFDAGQGLSEHTAPFDAVVQVLEGEAQLQIGGKGYTLPAGQLIIMPAHVPHAVQPAGRFKMLLTMIKG